MTVACPLRKLRGMPEVVRKQPEVRSTKRRGGRPVMLTDLSFADFPQISEH